MANYLCIIFPIIAIMVLYDYNYLVGAIHSKVQERHPSEETPIGFNVSEKLFRQHLKGFTPYVNRSIIPDNESQVVILGVTKDSLGAPINIIKSAFQCDATLTFVISTEQGARNMSDCEQKVIGFASLDNDFGPLLMKTLLPSVHATIIGPNLGHNETIWARVYDAVEELKRSVTRERPLPAMIISAEGLKWLAKYPKVLQKYQGDIYLSVFPNELTELKDDILGTEAHGTKDHLNLKELCNRIHPHTTLIIRGPQDEIVTASHYTKCTIPGSEHQIPGKNDVYTGALLQFATLPNVYDMEMSSNITEQVENFPRMLAAYGACAASRRANQLAFEHHNGSVKTYQLIKHVKKAVSELVS